MGRKKGSYKFEKRQKELKKQKKKQEKIARRQNKATDDSDEQPSLSDFGHVFNPSSDPDADSKADD